MAGGAKVTCSDYGSANLQHVQSTPSLWSLAPSPGTRSISGRLLLLLVEVSEQVPV